MGVVIRMVVASVVCMTAVLGLLPAWFVVDDLLVQDRTVVNGRILETGAERVSAGRGTTDRLLLTVEGQSYVFYRSVGWFGSREALLTAVETGEEAFIEVRMQDLADQTALAPDDRRIEIVGLTRNGTEVFTHRGLLLPRIVGASTLALVSLLALALAFLLVARPALMIKVQ